LGGASRPAVRKQDPAQAGFFCLGDEANFLVKNRDLLKTAVFEKFENFFLTAR
jgi:hypothetical protein